MSASAGSERPGSEHPARVPVLDVLGDVGVELDRDALTSARLQALAQDITLRAADSGSLPAALERSRCGVLVCDGFFLREVTLRGRTTAELVGPGDVLLSSPATAELLPCEVSWRLGGPVRLAALDDEFARYAAQWPGIFGAIARRIGDRAARLAVERTMLAIPNVEMRIVFFLDHCARHWGRVRPEGVVVPVALTHELLGLLVNARRPTVTTAIGRLRVEGVLEQRADRTWLLRARTAGELMDRVMLPAPTAPARRSLAMAPDQPIGQRLLDQRLRLAHIRDRHELALATMRDRADVLRIRSGTLRSTLLAAQHDRRRKRTPAE